MLPGERAVSEPVISSEVRAKYLRRRGEELARAREMLGDGAPDWEAIADIGHRIKGSGETFGYDELTALGDELEVAASAAQAVAVSDALSKLEAWLRAVVRPGPEPEAIASSSLSLR
jgi:HPt (histidine-containing phosphotransfer) domain-containing protein